MRKLALIAAAALALGPAATTHAAPKPVPLPQTWCDYNVLVEDPADPTRLTGVLTGGPVAVADLPDDDWGADANPVEVTLTCSVQSNSYSHFDPDDFTASGSGTAVAAITPVPFSVPKPADEWHQVSVCSRVDVLDSDGATHTFYSNSQNGMWTTWGGTCTGAPQCLALGSNCTYYLALLEYLVDELPDPLGPVWAIADPVVCAQLAARSPGVPGVVDIDPTGDVYVLGTFFWDCPPYA